jgi:hypothetical protein
LLYEEHDKVVEVEKFLALEIKRNEMLAFDLSSFHASISILKSINIDLNARIEKLNISSSSLDHVSICNRCKDHDISACVDHASTIAKLNNQISQLNVPLKTCKNEIKIKFDRDAYTIGRHPSIKDGPGFHGEPGTQIAIRPPNSLWRSLWLVVIILFMIRRTMLLFILMLRMLKMFIMMLVMIVLFTYVS